MSWIKISLPLKLLQRNEVFEIAYEFNDVIYNIYMNSNTCETVLLCDDPKFQYGSVYISPKTMHFPLLKEFFESYEPLECDINTIKNLFYLAGDKKYAEKIIHDINYDLTIEMQG